MPLFSPPIIIEADIRKPNNIKKPVVTQNDSVVLQIEVFENKNPFDLTGAVTVSLASVRKDGVVVVTPGSAVGNVATFDLGANEVAVTGEVKAKAQFYDADGRVSTLSFAYLVEQDPTGSGFIPSVDEETLIEFVMNNAQQKIDELSDVDVVDLSLRLADNETKTEGIMSVKDPMFGAKGDGVANDTASLQNAINYVALNKKRLYIPNGTYLISSPLVLPSGVTEWGIEVFGEKSETKYQYLPGSKATIIKAIAAMPSIITNRGINPSTDVAYYNVVKNLILDGNNLAVKGYVNGWQDKFLDSTVIRCTGAGVSFGDLTNLTIVQDVTMTLNYNGFESIDSDNTIWYLNRCTIRENTNDGAVVSSAVGAVLTSCVFEANQGRGILLKGTTDPLKRVTGLKFSDTCYFEGNTGYAIELDSTGTLAPTDIEFDKPWINAPDKAINIIKGQNVIFKNPNLSGMPLSDNYFVNNGSDTITLSGNETTLDDVNLKITGTKAKSVTKIMLKTIGDSKGQVFSNVLKASVLQPKTIVCTNNKTLLPEELAGTLLSNTGQSGANININLPIPLENFRFRWICTTTQLANNFKISSNGEETIYLDGVATPKRYVQIINPKMGDCIEFMAFAGDNYYWIAKVIRGTWSAY